MMGKIREHPTSNVCGRFVFVDEVAYYRDGIACRKCRWWVVEVTAQGDERPVYIHTYPIPTEA